MTTRLLLVGYVLVYIFDSDRPAFIHIGGSVPGADQQDNVGGLNDFHFNFADTLDSAIDHIAFFDETDSGRGARHDDVTSR